ncbi:MAG: pilus assembly PilX N-terminal domain-containing protein [Phycisphaerae bacterium]|nr:pilus assembly PilX N-terminal domain-containing protein [Phycisphaerae bacterium]
MTSQPVSCHRQRGIVLILTMIILVVFASLAVSMTTLSDINLQVSNNQRCGDSARYAAESGVEVLKFWLSQVTMSGTSSPTSYLTEVNSFLQTDCNLPSSPTLSELGITLPVVSLDSQGQQRFSASLVLSDTETLRMTVIGEYQGITRTIQTDYKFGNRANSVFNYGVASRGPLSLSGNIDLDGLNIAVESNAYIESLNDILALEIIGNSHIGGDVKISNPLATVNLQGGKAGIGGETGQDAIDQHVDFGVPPAEFPEPITSAFESYAVNVMDADTDTSANASYDNLRIPAGLNPHFSGNVTLRGVIFIETPNVVTFTGNVDMTGIIVGDGDWTDNSGTNQINITGNMTSLSIADLPDEAQFDGLQEETGTFIIAPGFAISIGGSFSTVAGSIAGNGISFHGNAGGTVNGSVVNYSDEPMTLSGNSDLLFNRSGLEDVPAGFVPQVVLFYDSTSYREMPTE